jgi:hypothetical protein
MKDAREAFTMITKRDILESLGAEIHEDRFITGMLVGIGVGAIVGGAVALLMSPKTGTEMRQLITETGTDLVERAKTKIGMSQNGGKKEAEKQVGGAVPPPGGSTIP